METLQTNRLKLGLHQEVYHKLCPECSEQMVEVEQVVENDLRVV